MLGYVCDILTRDVDVTFEGTFFVKVYFRVLNTRMLMLISFWIFL